MSGQEIGSTGGTIFGLAISGGNPFVGAFFGAAGSLAGSALDPTQLDDIVGTRVEEDIDLTSTGEGHAIVWVWGLGPITCKINWSPGIVETEHVETEGGKGSPEQETRTFTYAADIGMILCRGPVELRKVWREDDLILDFTETAGPVWNPDFLRSLEEAVFYHGSMTQLPSPLEQLDKGIAGTPAYRGIARLTFEQHDVTDALRIPTFRCEVATGTLTPTFPREDLVITDTINSELTSLIKDSGQTLVSMDPGGVLTFINLGDRSETLSIDLNEPAVTNYRGGDFDLLENYYGCRQESPGALSGSLVKYDANTLAVIGKTELNEINGGPYVIRAIGDIPDAPYIVVAGQLNRVYVVQGRTMRAADADVVTGDGFPKLNVLRTHDLNTIVGGAHGVRDLAVDINGDCWIMARETVAAPDTTTFIRLSGEFGDVEEIFTGIAIVLNTFAAFCYEETTHSLIVVASGDMWRWDIATETLTGPLAITSFNDEHISSFRQGPLNGKMWMPEGSSNSEFDVVNLVRLRSLADTNWPGGGTLRGGQEDRLNGAMVKASGTTVAWQFLDRSTGGQTTLDVVFDDVSSNVGFAAAETDATELSAVTVEFLKAGSRGAARSFLEKAARAHFVRARPKTAGADWGVEFILRGQTPSFALTEDDLGASTGEVTERIKETFKDPLEQPQRIDVQYDDRESDYEKAIQPSTRAPAAVPSRRVEKFTYPGVLTTDGARQMGEKFLHTAAVAATGKSEIAIDYGHSAIDPGDVGTVSEGGIVRTQEVQKMTLGADLILLTELENEDDETFASTATGQPRTITKEVIEVAGPSKLFVLDVPGPSSEFGDRLARIMFAGPSSAVTNWRGVLIEQSTDGASNWAVAGKILPSQVADHGLLNAVLPTGPTTTFDRTNTIEVTLFRGTISSATESQILEDEDLNPFFVLGDQGWEMGQYTIVTALGGNRYSLSVLRRGRRNTENYMTGHTKGVPIIFPNLTTAFIQEFGVSEIDIVNPNSTFFRAVEGTGIARSVIEHIIIGRSKKPWSPTGIEGSVATDIWTITGTRRSRDGLSLTMSSVPIGEDIEAYEIDILDAPGGAVVRTITETASANGSVTAAAGQGFTATYDDDDQIADFSGVQTTIHIRAYQMSSLVTGFRGEFKAETLEA